jgi:hypothetical protein
MDLNKAIEFAQLINSAYGITPADLTNSAGMVTVAGGKTYTVVTTVYANDLATDMNPGRGADLVSIGLIFQAAGTGDVVVAIRGTEGILEWLHDAEFLQVTCPFWRGPATLKTASRPCTIRSGRVYRPIRRASSLRLRLSPSRSRSARLPSAVTAWGAPWRRCWRWTWQRIRASRTRRPTLTPARVPAFSPKAV